MRKALLVSLLLVCCLVAAPARAAEHGSFGFGLNTSLSALAISGNNPLASGALSFRAWVTPRFAVDPQFGLSVQAVENGSTTFGFLFGSRFLYAAVKASGVHLNVGGEFLMNVASVSAQGGASTSAITLLFGPLMGIEYFFSELRNFSFEVYLGVPFAIQVKPGTVFTMAMGGNVLAGFHYYF
jgi:opacity protein-like surface antigen